MAHAPSMFSSLKVRLWFRRLSVSSPRIAVRNQAPLALRLFLWAILVLGGGIIAVWIFDLRQGINGSNQENASEQLIIYKEALEKLGGERDKLSSSANAAESQLIIERSAQKHLATQVKTLEAENIRLKEDLAFFESLLPNATGPQGIAIRRIKIDQIAPDQLRYRLLIMQGGKGDQHFSGSLQLAVNVLQQGKNVTIVFPGAGPAEGDKYKLGFKHYQRVEGTLTIPDGAAVKAVQARVFEKGQLRIQQSVNL